ncbi:hypothetical protein PV11_00417 [Exophiala sideris]|uniref:Uncharacterized protein n=1 Tax=Exophiala sideris TaxID=1016849 RepID=A0A0D1YT55_9EURO|nr:hypothetical protein PV11_00417 [Exophiala sideris]
MKTMMEDTSPYVFTREELEHNGSLLIPPIIHQVFLGFDGKPMPEHWREPQRSCIDLHPDWEYMFWTNQSAHQLLEREYPWFTETWENYGHWVQRADSIRYFILEHYGGVYIDLDNGCRRRLEPLLSYPAWMPGTTNHLGLTNHIMAAVPHHPYFRRLIDSLDRYNYNWILPYLTIMNSAGPHFVSMVWSEYLNLSPPPKRADEVRIIAQEEYVDHAWSFFTKATGGTWHHFDTALFRWIGHHILLFVTVSLFGLCAAVGAVWLAVWRMLARRNRSAVEMPQLDLPPWSKSD